jgi:hypothetical protein
VQSRCINCSGFGNIQGCAKLFLCKLQRECVHCIRPRSIRRVSKYVYIAEGASDQAQGNTACSTQSSQVRAPPEKCSEYDVTQFGA